MKSATLGQGGSAEPGGESYKPEKKKIKTRKAHGQSITRSGRKMGMSAGLSGIHGKENRVRAKRGWKLQRVAATQKNSVRLAEKRKSHVPKAFDLNGKGGKNEAVSGR